MLNHSGRTVALAVALLLGFVTAGTAQTATNRPEHSSAYYLARGTIEQELEYLGIRDKVDDQTVEHLAALKMEAESPSLGDEQRLAAFKELLTAFRKLQGAAPLADARLDQMAQAALAMGKGQTTPFGEFGHVEKRGTGPVPMILIADLGSDWRVFESFMERHADRFTMYAVTFPGSAGAPSYPRPATCDYGRTDWLDSMETAIAKLVEREKLDRVVVIGHQVGGYLAVRAAVEHPKTVAAAVVLNGLVFAPMPSPADPQKSATHEERVRVMNTAPPAGLFPRYPRSFLLQRLAGMRPNLCKDAACQERLEEMMVQMDANAWQHYYMELLTTDLTADLERLSVPLLVVPSVFDQGAPMAAQNAISRTQWEAVKSARAGLPITIAPLEETRAFAMQDNPNGLDRALRAFLGSVGLLPAPAPNASR